MKKILLLTASAILLLASCQKSEVVVNNDGLQEISFQSYSGRELTKAALNSGSFNVTAYKQDNSVESLYYSNVTYTWNNTCFASDPAKYWPSTGKLDFYAVMPTSLTADKKVKFTADGTTDFSAATLTGQTSTSNPSLTFGHKLTKVAFKAVGADTRLMYEITGITLTAKDTATFDISAGTWGSNGTKTNTYTVLSAKDTIKAGTSAAKSVGSTLYLLPANAASLNVKYNVYENGQLIDNGAATSGITVDLSSTSANWAVNSSYLYTLTLNLTSSAKPITFNAEQTDWGSETSPSVDITQNIEDSFTTLRQALSAASNNQNYTASDSISVNGKTVTVYRIRGNCLAPVTIPTGVTLKYQTLQATTGNAGAESSFIIIEEDAELAYDLSGAAMGCIASNKNISICILCKGKLSGIYSVGAYPDNHYAIKMEGDKVSVTLPYAIAGKVQSNTTNKPVANEQIYLSEGAQADIDVSSLQKNTTNTIKIGIGNDLTTCYCWANGGPRPF